MSNKLPLFLLVFLGFASPIFSSCSNKPDDIISEGKLVSVITDMQISDAAFDNGQGSSTGFPSKTAAERGVLAKHEVSVEEYRKTMEWYGSNPDEYQKIWKEVEKKLTKKLTSVDPDTRNKSLDKNNIWPYSNHLVFMPEMIAEGLTFSISDPDLEKGGYMELKMITSDLNTSLNVMLGADYENGESSYISRNPSGYRDINLRLQTDSARRVKRLYGYIRPYNRLNMMLTIDSISLVKMPFDSTEYYRITSQIHLNP